MILVDARCDVCGRWAVDVLIDRDAPVYPICCDHPMARRWHTKTPAVRPDSIPGGLWIHHGLCNEDGTPRRYDSQTEITEACRAKGLARWTDGYSEDRTKDARVHDDWLKSGEAQQARRDRVEARQEKYLKRDREAARR